ncbi:MAG: mannose-1-phosphate guanylyltransferase/mannose-6-phosphate isomerase [Rhizobiales bacterium]|nr:mannose-1-phosphate guanylyltransferase/mannose-6-phosphate isomerase [Hyphomicrobiales bacterium]
MYIIPVILSGGASGRLWPLTGEKKPKTLLRISSEFSLLQSTLLRANSIAENTDAPQISQKITPKIITVTNQLQLAATLAEYDSDLMPKLGHHIILEPVGRDTAAAVVNALLCANSFDAQDPVLVFLPADHIIENGNGFKKAVIKAALLAQKNNIVSIGIWPDKANTAYGYMQVRADKVVQFIEKPSEKRAIKFVSDGNYYWNSGIFCSKVSVLLEQLDKHCPELLENCKALFDRTVISSEANKNFYWLNKQMMEALPKSSIDYALMEKLETLSFVEAEMDWRDIGSWDSYLELFEKDKSGNVAGDMAFAEESNNCLVHTEHKPIALVGVDDIIVIDSADGILVADRSHVQNIKGISRKIVQKQFANMSSNLAGKRSDNFAEPQEVKRPWGSFFVLSQTDTHKVKRLEINAHSSLSLQSHEFRSEHWVVVEGEANVQLAGHHKTLTLDQTLFVPKGVRHRIKNKTAQRLVIVETQTGTYFGEDDEVRYEDEYGRADKIEIKQ